MADKTTWTTCQRCNRVLWTEDAGRCDCVAVPVTPATPVAVTGPIVSPAA